MSRFKYPLAAVLVLLYQGLGFFFFSSLVIYLPKLYEFTVGEENSVLILAFSAIFINVGAVFASVIADNYVGRFRASFWTIQLSILGALALSFAAERAIPVWLAYVAFYFGAFVVSVGAGAFLITVPTLVADQLTNRSQQSTDAVFHYHFIIGNFALFAATSFGPLVLNNVKCFGNCHCTPLFYGLLLIVAISAQILIIACWSKFRRVHDLRRKRFKEFWNCVVRGTKDPKPLTSAEQPLLLSEHSSNQHFSNDVRQLGRMAQMFLSLSFFYAIYYMNILMFVKQGNKLSANIGDALYLSPQTLANSRICFNMVFSVLFYFLVFPLVDKKIKCTPLRRIVLGCMCVVLSLTAGGIIETQTTTKQEHMVSVTTFYGDGMHLCQPLLRAPFQYLTLEANTTIRTEGAKNWTLLLRLDCGHNNELIEMKEGLSKLFMFHRPQYLNDSVVEYRTMDYSEKPSTRTIFYLAPFDDHRNEWIYALDAESAKVLAWVEHVRGEVMTLESPIFGKRTVDFYARLGLRFSTFQLSKTRQQVAFPPNRLDSPNEGSILWQFTLYFFMALGDSLVIVGSYQFAYNESPSGFKTIAQGLIRLMALLGIIWGYLLQMLIGAVYQVIFSLVLVMSITTLVLAFHASKYEYVESNAATEKQLQPMSTTSQMPSSSAEISASVK